MMKKEDVKSYYEDTTKWSSYVNSRLYKRYFKSQEAIITRIIRKISKVDNSKKLLDAGCGYGRYTRKYVEMGLEVYAVDLSENMINNVKDICLDTEVGDISSTKFDDNFFDIVACVDVSDHLESFEDAIIELKRVLKSDGALLVTVTNNKSLFYALNRFLRAVFKLLRINYGTPISKGYSKSKLDDILKSNFKYSYIIPLNYIVKVPIQYIGVASNNSLKIKDL
jgi:2-polyprenyl-3-methyl-5-hydroxy-6-metoxy-1,4-benzoquinol methylase